MKVNVQIVFPPTQEERGRATPTVEAGLKIAAHYGVPWRLLFPRRLERVETFAEAELRAQALGEPAEKLFRQFQSPSIKVDGR